VGATDSQAFLANRIPITPFSSRIASDTFIGAVQCAHGAEKVHQVMRAGRLTTDLKIARGKQQDSRFRTKSINDLAAQAKFERPKQDHKGKARQDS